MYKHVTKCRACGNTKLIPACDLGVQPLANDFTLPGQECAGHAPLKVMFCEECTLAQLSVVVDPKIIYSNYPYVTSKSQTMLGHFELLWKAINQECNAKSVVEIGSNDGGFLKFCLSNGATMAVGIDPALNLVPDESTGIVPITRLFDSVSAERASELIKPDVIVARHVFAHIDDWQAFMKDLDIVASRNTLVVIEVPYVTDMLEGVEFDTIYHEHLSYVSLKAVEALLKNTNFHLHKVLRFHIHGGAIVMILRRNDSDFKPDDSVATFLSRESVTLDDWARFNTQSYVKIESLREIIHDKRKFEGARICGFGASAKSTVWLNSCGLTGREIQFICDCTPSKQGKLSPGNDIPVVSEANLMTVLPEYAILFAWNFETEIIRNNQAYLDGGGHFIIPGKTIEIV